MRVIKLHAHLTRGVVSKRCVHFQYKSWVKHCGKLLARIFTKLFLLCDVPPRADAKVARVNLCDGLPCVGNHAHGGFVLQDARARKQEGANCLHHPRLICTQEEEEHTPFLFAPLDRAIVCKKALREVERLHEVTLAITNGTTMRMLPLTAGRVLPAPNRRRSVPWVSHGGDDGHTRHPRGHVLCKRGPQRQRCVRTKRVPGSALQQ
mmetsp:Transcript_16450/g.36810  ORF Transcript_16450/g.36810 Transcript_16450/m.36810 type:complete len:207 (+) Transcript_16450:130-750(+)|eukprot:CAMPEP_0181191774 /NCGR_PEP_ID=MMETSP1096-20121128/12913_1 /TAXON_ID=156174 ORGANISM="Chrysochromulina ericina, Strain CCMP281" /NCGR_SAMPLE_ID=MMETSP1096 /ASSEMBLY_ACC=CAM_ASM_000453 /LENGTH=206 /DNA_ID=CAMNT_0023281093 /DNA_START=104 /DNA_END=724 /DNA_ORIENTATION=+